MKKYNIIQCVKLSEGITRRLLREKQQPKIPEETGFVSEVVEVLPAESAVLFRSEVSHNHSLIIF